MNYSEVQRLQKLQTKIDALRSQIPNDLRVSVGESTLITANGASVEYAGDTALIFASRFGIDESVLPDGVRYHKEDSKRYLCFVNGTGKDVNYLIPDDGLRLQRLPNDRYHALNPIQDYIIEESKELLAVEKANCDKFCSYIRAMWTMLECPPDFQPVKDKGSLVQAYSDASKWHDYVIMRRFYFEGARWRTDWVKRDRDQYDNRRFTEPKKNFQDIIKDVKDHFTYNHTAYEVKKKSPYTAPHCNSEWSKLERLRKAGRVPQ
jgi:hypothetical protein